MSNETVTPTSPRKKGGWLRLLGWLFGGIFVLAIVAYFVGTSGAFLKGVILPRVGKAVNADISVSDASISPFHEVVLKDLKVKTTGADPLVAISEVRLRYSLMDIIGGNINVEEVAVVSPTIVLVMNPDGSSNLDPLTKSGPKETTPAAKPTAATKPSKPLRIDLKKFSLTGATLRAIMISTNGAKDIYELSNLNLTLSDLKNGQTAKLALSAAIRAQKHSPSPALAALLQASLNGSLDLGLTADAKLATAKGNLHLGVDRAEGVLSQLASFSTDLDCDLTPTDLKGLALRFQKGTASLGQMRVSGPLDMAKLEGRLVIEIPAIDKQLFNLATTGSGMDFGNTVFKATNTITLAQSGSLITAGGQFSVNNLQVTRANQTTPSLDFQANYDVSVDRSKANALLRALNLTAVQEGSPILRTELANPITVAWGNAAGVAGDSGLTLAVTGLDLAKWKPLLGKVVTAGVINARMKLLSQQAGKQLSLDLNSSVENLTLAPAGQPATPAAPGSLTANLTANFGVDLSAGPKLPSVKGAAHFGVDRAGVPLAQLASFATDLDCDLTPTQIKGLAVRFQKGSASLGQVRVSGPFDMAKSEGRIVIEIPAIDKQLLNLAAANSGMDFGSTVIRSTNTIELANAGKLIKAGGQFNINSLQVTLTNQTTPTLDFQAAYDVSVDTAQSSALLRAVTLNGSQQGSPVLHAELSSPMTIAWGKAAANIGDSTLNFGITDLNLANWKPFLGTVAPSGVLNARMNLLSQQAGKQLTLDLNSTIENLTVIAGSNTITQAGVSFQMNGKANDFKQFSLGQFKLQISQANQPLITASGSANSDQEAQESSVKLTTQVMVARLLQTLSMPASQAVSNAPSEVDLAADVAVRKKVTDIRQLQVSLAPTARATNQLSLTGKVDTTQAGALQGNLKLTADSLDFTTYYDLFMGGNKAPAAKPAAASTGPKGATTATAKAAPAQEPAPITLPIGNFTVDTSIGRLYLHEIEITNFQTSTKLDSGHATVNPFKLALNGAPVSSSIALDLSVPGYKYDLSFNATEIPLAPLVNTFQPDRKGQISGTLTSQMKITGAGVTGASLQTNLAGQFYIGTTNLNLAVQNVQNKILKGLLTVIVGIPDLAKDPASAATSLLSKLTGSSAAASSSELQQSVVDAIVVRGTAGSGQVNLQQASVRGSTFLAESTGAVTLNAVLTNSTLNFPVSISLARPVAQRINLLPANTATNAVYAKLPDFLTMKGTVGAPKTDIDKMALVGMVAQGVGGKAGGLVQGLGGLLGGSSTPSAVTNAAAAKTNSLLQNLGGLLGKPAASTNSPSAPTNASPVNDLLNGLFGPKKK